MNQTGVQSGCSLRPALRSLSCLAIARSVAQGRVGLRLQAFVGERGRLGAREDSFSETKNSHAPQFPRSLLVFWTPFYERRATCGSSRTASPSLKTRTVPEDCDTLMEMARVSTVMAAAAAWRAPRPRGSSTPLRSVAGPT